MKEAPIFEVIRFKLSMPEKIAKKLKFITKPIALTKKTNEISFFCVKFAPEVKIVLIPKI